MFRFGDPTCLYLLAILPLLAAFYLFSNYRRHKRIRKYGDPDLLRQLMPDVSSHRMHLKFWLTFAAIALIIFVLARPQFGSKMETVKRSGIETVIALDISNSMLAEDVQPNRLEKSKRLVSKLMESFTNDKVGMIVFAGQAFTQLPITSDYISAKMFLDAIDPSLIASQGTDIGGAIDLAMKSFTPKEEVGRAIIIITDGENHEGGAEEAARAASEKGMLVYVLGVGSPEGAPIPANTGRSNDFRKDKDGNVIVTRLNEEMCRQIAQAGKGMYIRVDNSNSAQRILQGEIDKLAKADVETTIFTEFDEQFIVVAWIALILLVLEVLVLERKNPLFKNIKLFDKEK
ncbi:MAG: VWA domain-containing protein [Bacteroidaceae bacterium]|nr:VWA domain-containing protein [Bacteroidaceae bacterium]MBR3897041.1 VWA domain-containing protein [Bacteroidaceae bacterium]